jgi:hypothetical protein
MVPRVDSRPDYWSARWPGQVSSRFRPSRQQAFTPSLSFVLRPSAGRRHLSAGAMAEHSGDEHEVPLAVWLKLQRDRGSVRAFSSEDGTTGRRFPTARASRSRRLPWLDWPSAHMIRALPRRGGVPRCGDPLINRCHDESWERQVRPRQGPDTPLWAALHCTLGLRSPTAALTVLHPAINLLRFGSHEGLPFL